MKQLNSSRHTAIYFLKLGLMAIVSLVFVSPLIVAAGSDIKPPKVTIISPAKGSKIENGNPRIEVSYSDSSGINEETVHLFVDRVDVAAKAIIEQEDVTGQVIDSPWHISYTSGAALTKGKHEARFSVEDKAGNRAELSWEFEVTVGAGGVLVSGYNTLRVDERPTRKLTDNLDLTVQGRFGENDICLNTGLRATNYPGDATYYYYHEYNFYADDYSLAFSHQQASAVVGREINASLDSELLEVGLTLQGAVAADTFGGPGGQYHWTAFSGQSGSSYASSSSVCDMKGAGGAWKSSSGNLQIGGYYVTLSGSKIYQYSGLKGNAYLANLGLLRFETIYGIYETNENSGLGWAFHWDKSLGDYDLGIDYTERRPDYPNYGISNIIDSSDHGLRTYEARVSTTFGKKHSLSFDGTYTRNNLDNFDKYSTETDQYLTADYDYHLNSDFSFSADYQGNFTNTQSSSADNNEEEHSFTLGIGQNIGTSELKISYTLSPSHGPDASDNYDQSKLLSSWTCPIGKSNLTPSVQWTYQKYDDGEYSKIVDTRLTWDRKLYSDLSRSSFAFFYKITEEMDDERTRVIRCGVLPLIYIKVGANSTLTLVYDYYKWNRQTSKNTNGIYRTINLTWKWTF